jgi:outer membrane biosynthesis protein TonB
MSTTVDITDLSLDILTALATQTQQLIDELAARDYAAAADEAYNLQRNINAGAATIRHESTVTPPPQPEEPPVEEIPPPDETEPPPDETEPPPDETEPPPEVDQPDTIDPAPKGKGRSKQMLTIDELDDRDEDAFEDLPDPKPRGRR